jgi:hypothetical protein
VRRTGLLFGIAAAAAGAYVFRRAREIAETEQRPLGEVLVEMPGRILEDLGTFGDDVREAADEGRTAAEREADWIDEDLAEADRPAEPADVEPDDEPTQ